MTVLLNAKMIGRKPWSFAILGILVVVLAFLMISTIPFPTFKQRLPFFNKRWKRVIGIPLCALFAIMRFHFALLVAFGIYFICTIYYIIAGKKNKVKEKVYA